MKKALLTTIIIILSVSASSAQKFVIGGVHRGGTSPVVKQKMVEKLKSEFNLNDDQANSVVLLQRDYKLKARSVKIATQTTEKEKKEKLQPIIEERNQKLKKYLNDEQIARIDEITQEVNRSRQK